MQHQESENLTSVRLEQYFLVLYRSKWSIFFILLLALMTAFIKNDTSQPVYQATVKLWVKQQDKGLAGGGIEDMFMSGMLGRTAELETLCEIIRSPSTLERVIDDLALLDSPIPDHRGRFVAWFSQRLGIDLLNSVPEMSRDSYNTFREAWVALEAPYLYSHLEPFMDPEKAQRIDVEVGEFAAIYTRLKRLAQLDDRISEVSKALENYIEEEYKSPPYPEPAEDALVLSGILSPLQGFKLSEDTNLYTQLASGIFQWRSSWLDGVLTVEDHGKIRRQIKREGARAVYDQLTKTGQLGKANGTEQPYSSLASGGRISFRDFQNYCMDPAFDYGEYQQLIQRQLQQREIEEEYQIFQEENRDHPDRGLWTDQDFGDYYRRVQHEELLEALQANLSVQPSRDADVIQITVKAPSQERAVSIANRLATRFEEFMADDARSRMQVTKTFASDRGAKIGSLLTEAANELSQYQKQRKTIALSADAETVIKGLSELELQRGNALVREESAQKLVDQLMAQLQQEDPTVLSSETFATNPVLENSRFKLIEAQIELAGLREKYPDGQNAEITRQEAVIKSWEEALAAETTEQITRTQSPNPLVANLTDQLIRAQSNLLAAKAEITTRDTAIAEYNQRIQQMPETEKELARLKRIVLRYEVLSETLAQAEQEAEMLEQAEPSNIVAFQPASFRQQLLPISPRRGMNLMLGGLIGLALGVGLAFLREYLDNTYGTVEEAQHDLELASKRINPAIQPTFLTMVPAIESVEGDRSYLITLKEPKSGAAEAFRIVRTKLQFMGTEAPVRCILVTSSTPGEGKSTISCFFTS